ncbi:Type II transport protein GspH [Marinomonas spartinae]|uniref:Type II transport protein GspH n=1 Tax=Marinomonas spartinae TaxID=1792290 RepID=A0A1A8TFC0_9GAMM|nr:GspH/FimT family protein [Marinomonas spartinae]SBS30851.1 Type II transport protein GspH [Marinomonas spartinae]SBS33347.1 Type II transport protein GspH [Marinomonas spartinae]
MYQPHQHGFAFIEVLCVLAILSILSFFGATHFFVYQKEHQDRQMLQDDMDSLSEALLEARQMAIKSGAMSFVCGGEDCSGIWSSGFEVRQREGYAKEYRRVQFDHDVSVHWQGFPSNKSRIEFLPNGLSSYQNGTFVFCLGRWTANIVLNQSGRFYRSKVRRTGESCV